MCEINYNGIVGLNPKKSVFRGWCLSNKISLTLLFVVLHTLNSVDGATRCYDGLGCFESGTLHALPQDPDYVRTSFSGSSKGHARDVTLEAVSQESQWKQQIDGSSLDSTLNTVFIIHGFTDSATSPWVTRMTNAFLDKGNFVVYSVDWSHAAKFPYQQAVANSFLVARQLSNFLQYLIREFGLDPTRVHLVGHSLGAQIAGNAGADLNTTRVARISGLDPAEPYFGTQNDSRRLDKTDAQFVDVIHTDGASFSGLRGYGSVRSQGHIDFFPNGGFNQPGCGEPNAPFGVFKGGIPLSQSISCSHGRAIDLFTTSLETSNSKHNNKTGCPLVGYTSCPSWDHFDRGQCHGCPVGQKCPELGSIDLDQSPFRGDVYLSTSGQEPYCGDSYVVEVVTSATKRHSYGQLSVSLKGSNLMTSISPVGSSNYNFHENQTDTHVITVTETIAGDISSAYFRFRKGTGLASLGTSDDLELISVSICKFAGSVCWTTNTVQGGVGSSTSNHTDTGPTRSTDTGTAQSPIFLPNGQSVNVVLTRSAN